MNSNNLQQNTSVHNTEMLWGTHHYYKTYVLYIFTIYLIILLDVFIFRPLQQQEYDGETLQYPKTKPANFCGILYWNYNRPD